MSKIPPKAFSFLCKTSQTPNRCSAGIFAGLRALPVRVCLRRSSWHAASPALGPVNCPSRCTPTWEQLINGSLDTQYAEIDGVVTAVHDQQIAMLTEGGKVTLDLSDFQSEELAGYQNALVRIRGCAFAFFNPQTHELDARSLRVMGGAVDVLQPAPRDLFDAPQKSIGELLLYDPEAAPFRRLKVSAQVIHGRAGEFFLTDGTNGIRVTTRNSDPFAVGDLAEAVGFLDLGVRLPS